MSTNLETISSKLNELAERLRKARIDDDFVETDLRQWTTRLQELKTGTMDVQTIITVQEDPSITLISSLNVLSIIQQSVHDEILVRVCGNVKIEDDGRTAIQRNSDKISNVRGRKEYSSGKHKIRFTVNKIQLTFSTIFGIISKIESLSEWPSSCYGWNNNDGYYLGGEYYSNDIHAENAMKGKATFTIELLLDCDNRKIRYFNEQTKTKRGLNINLEICPFPWQLFFYLHDVGDRVQLL